MKANILTLAITLTVGIILAGSLLMPVLNDATTTERTFENQGYFELKEYTGDDIVYSATWDHTEPKQITINDEVVPIDYTDNVNTSIILDGNFFLRYFPTSSNGGVSLYYGTQAIVTASVDNGLDMTITYSEGTLTFSNNSTTREISVETFYSIANDGPFVMKKGDVNAYMNADSLIYGSGRTSVGTDIVGTLVSGTAEEVDVTIWRGSATPRDITINKTAVSGYNDLYSFSSVEFIVDDTLEDNPTTEQTITYSYVVVPKEVTSELSQHLAPGEIAILNALPILIITALVVMAAGALYLKRDD